MNLQLGRVHLKSDQKQQRIAPITALKIERMIPPSVITKPYKERYYAKSVDLRLNKRILVR